jgi:hypothetical protein
MVLLPPSERLPCTPYNCRVAGSLVIQLGRPGDRTLIEFDAWGNVLSGAAVVSLGYSVEYEKRPAIERFTVFQMSRDQRAEIHYHEISTDPVEMVPANR